MTRMVKPPQKNQKYQSHLVKKNLCLFLQTYQVQVFHVMYQEQLPCHETDTMFF